MEKREVLDKIRRERLIPVIRTADANEARRAVDLLSSSAFSVFEITLTIPDAVELIANLTASYPELLIGAGTVLHTEQARRCKDAGAKFLVSPILKREIVEYAAGEGLAVIPAGLTPNEVFAASEAGADAVKVFPCGAMGGAGYIKALKSVFPEVRLIPTGGVTAETAGEFLNAGAFAVGAGTDLVDINALRRGDDDAIKKRIEEYRRAVI